MSYRGDFSKDKLKLKAKVDSVNETNFNGILHQQGRVITDADWNAQTIITNDWQDTAGRNIISGKKVAAIPAENPDAFKIKSALVSEGKEVKIVMTPGMAWVDGLPIYLESEIDVSRTATYLEPPIQNPVPGIETIGEGVRDAVIIELRRTEVNGFQMPGSLIEPALGGPDTTERVNTSIAFRLLRLEEKEDCSVIADKLNDDFSKKGKLTVSLEPPKDITSDCDCPKSVEGGYTGFEHALYRIEVARVNGGSPPMFKWSQFNGGLVGRGIFDAAINKVTVKANLPAIQTCGIDSFYLEAVEYDPDRGHWDVSFGIKATLNAEGDLQLVGLPLFGTIPATTSTTDHDASVFFRLWNDVRLIGDFVAADPPGVLIDGIHLKFDPASADNSNYAPEDHWTFPVRAGEISNPAVLIDGRPPDGVEYHRASLGILNWDGTTDIGETLIEDCREIFQPLTNTYALYYVSGDGQEAAPGTALPFPIIAGVAKANNNSPVKNALIRFTVVSGEGTLGPSAESSIIVPTGLDGLAACTWTLGSDKADQQVKAEMLGKKEESIHLPLFFNAKTEFYQGNCTIVIRPGDDIATVVQKLPATGGKICFTAGIFNLKKTVQFANRSNLLIEGTGNSSQIIIEGAESAFLFTDCKRIHINQLSVESRSPSRSSSVEDSKPVIKGVVMFRDCSEIKTTNLTIACNQRFIHTQSCLTIYNKDENPGSQCEISSCTLHVGSMQIGILLVNTSNVIVKDNFIDVVPTNRRSKTLFAKSMVLKNNVAYRNLVFALDKIGKPIASAKKVLNMSGTVQKLLERGISLQRGGRYSEALAIFKRALDIHNRSGNLLDQAISPRRFDDTSSRFQDAANVHKSITTSLSQAISLPEGPRNLELFQKALSENRDTFVNLLNQGISSIGTAERSVARKELSFNRSVVYHAILGGLEDVENSPTISRMVSAVIEDLAMGYQGIAIGGSEGENLQIFNNTIGGMIQGIHSGASINDPKKQLTKYIKKISICDNKIELRIPIWYRNQNHGIFVGNVDMCYVKDNTISVERINNISLRSRTTLSPTVGIQIFGFHGKMVLISENVVSVSNTDIGIRFCTTGFLPQHGPKSSLRALRHNVVYGSPVKDYDLSGSEAIGSIKFVGQDNVP